MENAPMEDTSMEDTSVEEDLMEDASSIIKDQDWYLLEGSDAVTISLIAEWSLYTKVPEWEIAKDRIYLSYQPHMRMCPDPQAADIFVKKQDLASEPWILIDLPEEFKSSWESEIGVVQQLMRSPHPNLAKYQGVVCDAKNRVVGIAYKKYECDLQRLLVDWAKDTENWKFPIPIGHIMSSIEAAVGHLHGLGLIHCDIRPANIFISYGTTAGVWDSTAEVVLGDFDAVHQEGAPLTGKHAPEDVWPEEYVGNSTVDKFIDYWLLERLRDVLEKCDPPRRSRAVAGPLRYRRKRSVTMDPFSGKDSFRLGYFTRRS
jgi:hypothetical protein